MNSRTFKLEEWAGRSVRLLLAAAFALSLTVGLIACNTTRGAGEDIEAAGEGIQDAAD